MYNNIYIAVLVYRMIPKLWCSRKGHMISPIKISRKYKIKRTNF